MASYAPANMMVLFMARTPLMAEIRWIRQRRTDIQ